MDTVWESMLDEIYECKVERNSEHTGCPAVSSIQNTRLLLDEDVQLTYGEMFGDVAYWMDMSVTIFDIRKE